MKRLSVIIVIVFVLIVSVLLFVTELKANGGGVWVNSPVWSVGNPVFRDIPEVSILSERLYIKCGHSHNDIRVKYVLWNSSDKDINNVDYAFPVDFVNGDYEQYAGSDWLHTPVNYIEFVVDGKTLECASEPEVLLRKLTPDNDSISRQYGWSAYSARSLYRKWFYTKFSIPKNSFLTLEVSYSVDSPYYGDGDAPYEDDRGMSNVLNYDFSPASHWGNGIIRDFYVQLDASELELAGLKTAIKTIEPDAKDDEFNWSVIRHLRGRDDYNEDTIYVSGLPFEGDGPVFTCRIRNFNLINSKPLHINYFHPSSFYSLLDCYIPRNAYQVKVSTEQKGYPPANLTDMSLETAWVPTQKGGIGDWIEFDFIEKDSLERVISLFLVNGYQKDQATYEQNNRVKRLKVTITRYPDISGETSVDSFFVTLPDAPYQPLNLTMIPHYSTHVEREDYSRLLSEAPAAVFDVFVEEMPVKTIRLTILDVYKGTKYDDTCLSEIMLYRFGIYDRYLPAFYDRHRRD